MKIQLAILPLLAITCANGHSQTRDFQIGEEAVRHYIDSSRSSLYDSITEKRISRLGDSVRPIIDHLIAGESSVSREETEIFLRVVRIAFAHPDLISEASDRQPQKIFFTLADLQHLTADGTLIPVIDDVRRRLATKPQ